MARYNEILVGRYNRMVQKLLSMKGPASLATISDEMFGVLSFFYGAENRYLEGWDRFGFASSQTAGGAGFRAGIRLRNPAGANVIAVVEKISFWNALLDTPLVNHGASTLDFTTVLDLTARFDARGRPKSSLILTQSGNVGAAANTLWQGTQAANVSIDAIITDIQEIPLLPGDVIDLLAGTLNQGLNAVVWWRERFLEDSERA